MMSLGTYRREMILMDPMTGRMGRVDFENRRDTKANSEMYLRLEPGQTVIVWAPSELLDKAPKWAQQTFRGKMVGLSGEWRVKFISGGPELPAEFATRKLASWTENGDERAKAFAGTALYSTSFDAPAARCLIDLGRVCESARVRVNGTDVAALIGPSYRVALEGLKDKGNLLEVEVTNTSANRIRDLDRRGVKWRNFSDINFVNIDYKPFDASKWPLRDSGLIGPVTLHAEK
jgi:hypothetical protein